LQTARVTRRDISSSIIAPGIIRPGVGAEVRVGSRISGVVKRLYTNIGDRAEKGKLLAELDPIENEARYNQATASLELSRANLNYARLDLNRQQLLLKKNFVSQDKCGFHCRYLSGHLFRRQSHFTPKPKFKITWLIILLL